MSHLVRDHVRCSEITWGTESVSELRKEGQVEIDLLIQGAIKRADGCGIEAAGRVHCVGEKDQPGLFVDSAKGGEDSLPGILGIGKDHGGELTEAISRSTRCRRRVEGWRG